MIVASLSGCDDWLAAGVTRHGCRCLLLQHEWRSIGVQQSRGWVHYAIHRPETHIMLFRRVRPHSPEQPCPQQFPLRPFSAPQPGRSLGISAVSHEGLCFQPALACSKASCGWPSWVALMPGPPRLQAAEGLPAEHGGPAGTDGPAGAARVASRNERPGRAARLRPHRGSNKRTPRNPTRNRFLSLPSFPKPGAVL